MSPLVADSRAAFVFLPPNLLRLWVGGISCSSCRFAFVQSFHIHKKHRRSFACDMRCDHSVGNGCVLSFVDDPWTVYPLTNAHLDVNATCLFLMKSTMRGGLKNAQDLFCSFGSRFTKDRSTIIPIATMIARLVTMKWMMLYKI